VRVQPERIEDDQTRPSGVGHVWQARTSVTLVEGASFCVSDANGDIEPHRVGGLFVRDTRIVSRWQLRIDGHEVEGLSVLPQEPYKAVFVGRIPSRPGLPEPTIVVERKRMVGRGLREDVSIVNHGTEAAGLDIVLLVDADFADLFQVKEQRPAAVRQVSTAVGDGALRFWITAGEGGERGVRVSAAGARARAGSLEFDAVVPAGGHWTASIEVVPVVDGEDGEPPFPLDRPVETAEPARRMRGWHDAHPVLRVDNTVLSASLATSEADLGALRIADPDHPHDEVVAAGAPWFMALFGRDSLLTSAMTLPFAPGLAMGTLRTLARFQGSRDVPMTDEQPGRILHEVRLGADLSLALGGESVYYGSIDSTPLFVVVAGLARRWGAPREELIALKPAVDRAIEWIERFGDRDGDGFVEYRRGTDRGLANQGWKDSWDAIAHSDGRDARPPIALAEVQGYCYAAFEAAAELERAWGSPERASELERRARELRARFHEAFWLPDEGFYALALDADKQPVGVVTSNIGHCLWTGIVDDGVADRVVDRLLANDMFTGFGIRTLSSRSRRYNPVSYHNGSVWPHDTVLAAAGMERYGRRDAALRVVTGLLDALEAFDGRLPELFCGFSRDDKAAPVPYPTSCSPQAWAAATPFEMLRICLGLQADAERRTLRVAAVPATIGRAQLEGMPLGPWRYAVDADADKAIVTGLPHEVQVHSG